MDQYLGYRVLNLNDEELAEFYSGMYCFPDMYDNEYGLIVNNGKIVDKICYCNNEYYHVRYPSISDHYGNLIAGRNEYQNLAIDLLQNRDIKVKLLRGVYGSGKDLLMTSAATNLIDQGKFKKIIFIRPNVTVANVPDIGFIPGEANEKLAWTLGPICDKVGGEEKLKTLLNKGTIEMMPLLYIRGRSFENAIVYVTEGQNMTTEIVKLLLSRIGEGSELWINGDNHQCDNRVYDKDNGLNKMVERLKGNPLFGYVYLPITERGQVANLANLLDD